MTYIDTWTLQKGFPVCSVERNYDGKEATFTQVRSAKTVLKKNFN